MGKKDLSEEDIKARYITPAVDFSQLQEVLVITTTKDENNLCVVNQIKYLIDFAKLQKNTHMICMNTPRTLMLHGILHGPAMCRKIRRQDT